jgi:hypothetical protein
MNESHSAIHVHHSATSAPRNALSAQHNATSAPRLLSEALHCHWHGRVTSGKPVYLCDRSTVVFLVLVHALMPVLVLAFLPLILVLYPLLLILVLSPLLLVLVLSPLLCCREQYFTVSSAHCTVRIARCSVSATCMHSSVTLLSAIPLLKLLNVATPGMLHYLHAACIV